MTAYSGSFPASYIKVEDIDNLSENKIIKALEEISRSLSQDLSGSFTGKDLKGFTIFELPKRPVKSRLTSDAINAAYRVGANQLLSLTKNILVQRMRLHFSEESKVRILVEMLDTEVGKALMGMFIGAAISQMPQVQSHPKTERLLKELRVSGMATLGNSAVESLFTAALPTITQALVNAEQANKKEDGIFHSEELNDLLVDTEPTEELLLSR